MNTFESLAASTAVLISASVWSAVADVSIVSNLVPSVATSRVSNVELVVIAPVNDVAPRVLFVSVCEPVNVATVASIVISSAFAVIPVPPITFTVTSPVVPPPVIPAPATTEVISPTGTAAISAST